MWLLLWLLSLGNLFLFLVAFILFTPVATPVSVVGLTFEGFLLLKGLGELVEVKKVSGNCNQKDEWTDNSVEFVTVVSMSMTMMVLLSVVSLSSKDVNVLLHISLHIIVGIFLRELIAGEDAGWKVLGVGNVVASRSNGGRLAPGAGVGGIA